MQVYVMPAIILCVLTAFLALFLVKLSNRSKHLHKKNELLLRREVALNRVFDELKNYDQVLKKRKAEIDDGTETVSVSGSRS
jgi:hypothetical protein